MNREPPEAFRKACRNLGQDLVQQAQALSDADMLTLMVETALIGLDRDDANVIRQYVAELQGLADTDDELLAFWWSLPSEVHFDNGQIVRRFVSALSERLSQPPYFD